MSFEDDFGQSDPFQGNSNSGLRNWAESVQKRNSDLEKQLADVQKQLTAQSVSSMFEDLGVPRSAAALYKGDADPEAIKSWVDNVKSAFGMVAQTTETTEPVAPVNPLLTPDQMNQYQQVTNAGADGRPSTSIEDYGRQVNQAQSTQDLINLFQTIR